MIQYIEKGHGLHLNISRAGHSIIEVDGVWESSNDAAVQQIIDNYTLEQCRDFKRTEILALAKRMRDKVVEYVSVGEMASWPMKLAEASSHAQGGEDTPMLAAEAAIRGITVAEIVAKVGDNAVRFASLEAHIGGVDGKHRDALEKLDTFEAIVAYDTTVGWPDV